MTRHALLALLGMMLALWAFTRACNPPIPAASDAPPSATWPPGQADPRGLALLPVTGEIQGKLFSLPARQSNIEAETLLVFRDWRWDQVAIAYAGKPTLAPVPSATRTPTPTHPPRATRTQRPTGTPTQGNMLPPPTCGAGTVEPGLWTPWPACYPHGPSFTPTPTVTDTPTPYPRDTPYDTETPEPTPTWPAKASPAAGGWVDAPETWRYYYPMMLVRARVKR